MRREDVDREKKSRARFWAVLRVYDGGDTGLRRQKNEGRGLARLRKSTCCQEGVAGGMRVSALCFPVDDEADRLGGRFIDAVLEASSSNEDPYYEPDHREAPTGPYGVTPALSLGGRVGIGRLRAVRRASRASGAHRTTGGGGTHSYQTHPDCLGALVGHVGARFVLRPSGVFTRRPTPSDAAKRPPHCTEEEGDDIRPVFRPPDGLGCARS